MKNFYTALCDFIFRPFYSSLSCPAYGCKVGRHPFYLQMQFLHFRLTRSCRKNILFRAVTPLPTCTYTLYLNPGADFLQHHLFVAGAYEASLTHCHAEELKTSDIFIDVGAHIGYYSLLARKLNPVGRVLAFEPQPALFKMLQKNSEINGAGVEMFNLALGSETGKKILYTTRFPEQASLLGTEGYKGSKTEIYVKKGDDVIGVKNSTACIKIDTEGYEFEVLEGLQQFIDNNRCTVFIEYHSGLYEKYYGKNYVQQKLEKWTLAGYKILYATGRKKGQEFKLQENREERLALVMRRVT